MQRQSKLSGLLKFSSWYRKSNLKLSIALHSCFEMMGNSIGFHSKLNKQQSFPGSHLPTSFLCDMHMLQNVRYVLLVWLIGEDIQKAHPKSINTSCSVNFLALLLGLKVTFSIDKYNWESNWSVRNEKKCAMSPSQPIVSTGVMFSAFKWHNEGQV